MSTRGDWRQACTCSNWTAGCIKSSYAEFYPEGPLLSGPDHFFNGAVGCGGQFVIQQARISRSQAGCAGVDRDGVVSFCKVAFAGIKQAARFVEDREGRVRGFR